MKALKQRKKSKAKSAVYTFVSVTVLLCLLVGGGVLYTWYVGQNSPEVAKAGASVKAQPRFIKPTQPKPDAVVGVSVQMLTSPVPAGGNASITIKTNAAANCVISVVYGAVTSKDAGLKPKVADDFGTVNWTWAVEPTVVPGKYPVNITCANAKKSGMVRGDLVVEKKSAATSVN